MDDKEQIKKRLSLIEDRNKEVEINKAWETSFVRRFTILVFTYAILGFYMKYIEVSSPWLNAIIPTAGFGLSTLSLSLIKKVWYKFFYK